jgi:hypothetical protein
MTSNGIDGAGAQATVVAHRGPSGPPVTAKDQAEQAELPREIQADDILPPGHVPAQVYDGTGRVLPPASGTGVDSIV